MAIRNSLTGVVLGASLATVVGFSSTALGWGAYGHQQINRAAAKIIKQSDVGKWMLDNIEAVERLSITPDCEWKANRGCKVPEDEHLRELTYFADKYEHPLHFFEPDAFIRNGKVNTLTIGSLPDGEYRDAFATLLSLFTQNIQYVLEFPRQHPISDPENPSTKDVTENGSAPWRVVQLYDLAVEALSRRNYELAMVYLGTMGHYVGDLSQPLHATMHYDGQVHSPSAKGVHAVFETNILNRAAKSVHAKKDPETKLWSSFEATEKNVLIAAEKAFASMGNISSHREIASSLIQMSASGYPWIEALMDNFCKATGEETLNATAEKIFMASNIGADTVLEVAETRMGHAAALLARLWLSASLKASQLQPEAVFQTAPRLEFDPTLVLENYPVPKYLPDDATVTHFHDDDGDYEI